MKLVSFSLKKGLLRFLFMGLTERDKITRCVFPLVIIYERVQVPQTLTKIHNFFLLTTCIWMNRLSIFYVASSRLYDKVFYLHITQVIIAN